MHKCLGNWMAVRRADVQSGCPGIKCRNLISALYLGLLADMLSHDQSHPLVRREQTYAIRGFVLVCSVIREILSVECPGYGIWNLEF